MKLNPEKCTFGMPAGQLLGYIIFQRGIEANPSKIKAIEALEPPTELRDVQKFAGCLASLSHFVSRLEEKAMPLYQLMKKTDHFVWSQRADDAFNDLKRALSMAPVLAAPASWEPMLLYITATLRVVNVVIVVERAKEGKELPVPGALSERSAHPPQAKLPAVPEGHVRRVHGGQEAEALL
jgi:hypothetical protein